MAYKEVERLLRDAEGKYRESKQKKWIIFVIGLILGGLIGYYLPITIYSLATTSLSRGPIDNLLNEMFGSFKVKDALSEEVMIVSFSYNVQEPRFYSKFEARHDPPVYDVTM